MPTLSTTKKKTKTFIYVSLKKFSIHIHTASGGSFKRKAASSEQMNLEGSSANHNTAEKAMDSIHSVKKKPSFTDNHLNDTGSKTIESGKETRPGPQRAPSTKKFPSSSFGNSVQAGYSPEQSKAEAEADAWEKAQMIKIKKR